MNAVCRNKCLNHLLDLANAHVESVILDSFYAGVLGCVDPDARKALKVPCTAYRTAVLSPNDAENWQLRESVRLAAQGVCLCNCLRACAMLATTG